ncbi:MAG: efflux RND transporter periplasmic adaptor subunit [Blastocatellia bacterium]
MKVLSKRNLSFSMVALTAVAILISSACRGDKGSKQGPAPPATTVIVAEVAQKTVPIYTELVGQTKAQESVDLRARVEGVLEGIHFKEGSAVKKGQLLFSIDKRPFEAALQSARAAQAKAESDLAQAEQKVVVLQAQAQLTEAEAQHMKAEQDLARLKPLAAVKAVTELELDAAVASEKTARASVDAREANLRDVEASVKYTIQRAAAEVSAAKARVTQALLELSYCSIYSPVDGIIGFRQVDEGSLVGKGGEATLLATVSLSDPLLVDFNLSETEYLRLVPREKAGTGGGLRFEMILSDRSVYPYQGTLKAVDRTVDPQTGTMKIEASFPNPKNYLKPGQFARVRAAVEQRENAILVPRRAIQELQDAKTVMIVDAENKVALRTVTVGEQSGDDIIVLSGLKPGERVIVEGMQKVRPGSEVKASAQPVAKESAGTTERS